MRLIHTIVLLLGCPLGTRSAGVTLSKFICGLLGGSSFLAASQYSNVYCGRLHGRGSTCTARDIS
ncbi:hypothetical protein RR46_01062 [Papilio xuthus]|uniref:Secreted protein n=1 Tax=Papilio xuthus TaxID=66420 RepID=A0A0N1IQJ0_PAPXU|nr:hypothetical protein RR46_01062 [Papilio xuthus]